MSGIFRRVSEEPVCVQHDPNDARWAEISGNKIGDEGRYVELVSRSLNGSEMCMGVDWLEPGQTHLLHSHAESEEWYYIVRGEALVRVDDEEQHCGPGTSIFIPAGARHRVHNGGTETCEFLWGFNCGDLKELTYIWYE
jgi:oxalate decarboxylase/phosphoglucose isomerase-like protein (cupin superfamily)